MPPVDATDVTDMDMEGQHPLQENFNHAEQLAVENPQTAIEMFSKILEYDGPDLNKEVVHKLKEHSIYQLGQLYAKLGHTQKLATLLQSTRPFFATIPKAKTGKIVRTIIDMVAKVKSEGVDVLQIQADLCRDSIEWCNREKHTFLRQRVESRLAGILFSQGLFQQAIELINRLVREVKKLDDKQLLVEIHLTESRLHHAIRNVPKAKAALTAARTASNVIYIVPRIQSHMDMMSGTLHAEERDYKTSYSYFFEAFETLAQLEDPDALPCLKYMLLSKVASGNSDDVAMIANGKHGMKYAGIDVDAMKAIAEAHKKRSLEDFEAATKKYSSQLVADALINRHLSQLYESLKEMNLLKIIEPFSCVEISHIAKLISLPVPQIELKLSQMILDHKFHGILDQGKGQLIVYDQPPEDQTYKAGLQAIDNVELVVDALLRRAEHLSS